MHVFLTLGTMRYPDGTTGGEHPAAWYHHFGGGRVFYTALGHTEESYVEPAFLSHVEAGISWAIGAK